MDEINRMHKEPAWGWIGVLIEGLTSTPPRPRADQPKPDRHVVAPRYVATPWSLRAPTGWSA